MAERLTPYLLRRVRSLPLADKAALMGELRVAVGEPVKAEERMRHLAEKMQEVAGVDVREDSSRREIVTARTLFMFVARREGFTQETVGNFVGRDHATVWMAEKRMADIFAYPRMYRNEIMLYNKYIESL